jgi:WD40 repeat protein/serine/threonine protein kinase
MSDERWERVKRIVHEALQLAATERERFVVEACAGDRQLHTEVDSLLAIDRHIDDGFLDSATAGGAIGGALATGEIFEQRFRLIRSLGEGGMGQVWLAEQMSPVRRPVAIKLIRAGMYDAGVALRFHAERQSLAIMDHPCIAKVFDAGATAQGQPYFVMEYVPGLPITEYCDQKRLKVRERLELFIQACDGVQHAHQKAVIHRDLKPANILIVEVDGRPVPRIIDFGLAKPAVPRPAGETVSTQFGLVMGTPGYMSPEQVESESQDVDTRTDVYSLGVILYVLLTGMQPFETKRGQRPSLEQWLRQLREEEAPRPSSKIGSDRDSARATAAARGTDEKQLSSQLRGDLDWITMKALERERERRYGTPTELAADLRRYLNDEPVSARPASTAYQIRKFIRRNRVAAAVAAMVILLALITSAAGLIAIRKQHEAQYQAEQTLQAQSRLLTQSAAQLLTDSNVAGAQGIILEVLTNPVFANARTPAAISVFQGIRAADRQLAVLAGHGGWVYSAAFSPDGARIVTASLDKTARIWDTRTGVHLATLTGHEGSVFSAAFSPDGSRIVTASLDKTARIWDAKSGVQLAALAGHGDRVYTAQFSPDGTRILTASADRTARIWDAATGLPLATIAGHDDFVRSAAFSPDGTQIVTASFDKTAKIWDSRTGKRLAVLAGHDDRVYSAAYSPDGKLIVTASSDNTARIWDARSGTQLTVISGPNDPFYSAAFAPGGQRIVTASDDGTARLWDVPTGALLTVLSGHRKNVYYCTFSPDGTQILTASADRTARVWDARTGAQLAVLEAHGGWVLDAAVSADGARIATAHADKIVRLWDATSFALVESLTGHEGSIYSVYFSPDGTRLVSASNDKTARIWDLRSGAQLATLTGHGERVTDAAFSPDGTRVVTASADKTARVWDARSGVQLAVLAGHADFVSSASYSPDGARILTSSNDRTARIWDARSGAQLAVLTGHSEDVNRAVYASDGSRIATASDDGSARIWDAGTGAQLAILLVPGVRVRSAAFSPDGSRIVTASHDNAARIWDARTGSQLALLSGHRGAANSASYSPDGTRIVTTSDDKTARIWDAAVPAELAAQIIWESAAETDPLSELDRAQLGLPADRHVRIWSGEASACDLAAASVDDPDRLAPGVLQEAVTANIAGPACGREIADRDHPARIDYQMGRSLLAQGDLDGARRAFETAAVRGYRAASVDLADRLLDAKDRNFDPKRAVSLYERAWQDGVPIAAFKIGRLNELGLPDTAVPADRVIRPNAAQAWLWYQKAADAGEPNALARFAESDETRALAQSDPSMKNAELLNAFTLYTAAAERARQEAWPDDAWKNWRYRRATLARLLAQEGMMAQVAGAYASVVEKWAPRPQAPGSLFEPFRIASAGQAPAQ